MNKNSGLIFTLLFALFFTTKVLAEDLIKISGADYQGDLRWTYPHELLHLALSKTEAKYGPYTIDSKTLMSRKRTLHQLKSGAINVSWAPTSKAWEEELIPLYFPLMKGLMGYRLFLIDHQRQVEFTNTQDLEQIKRLKAGVHSQWSITKILKHYDFSLIAGNSYQGLFSMLAHGRFDYYPRGINEVFDELNTLKEKHPSISIETSKALYLRLPVYFFVSPKEPQLAKRIQEGVWIMHHDGSFDKLFNRYYSSYIKRAKLNNRTIFTIKNPFIPSNPIYQQNELWLDPGDFQP